MMLRIGRSSRTLSASTWVAAFSGRMSRVAAFTLLEVLVSVVVLSIGIVLVLRAMETSLTALSAARDTLWASKIASSLAEELRFSSASGVWGDLSGNTAGVRRAPHGEFSWEMRISPVGGTTEPGMKEIVITVWRQGGVATRMTISTLLRDGEKRGSS